MSNSYKFQTIKCFISEAIGSFYADASELKDEMDQWADSMEERMSHVPKYEEVTTARDELDQFCGDEPTPPEGMKDDQIDVTISVPRRKRQSPGRQTRLDNAVAHAEAAIAAIEEQIETLEQDRLDDTGDDDDDETQSSTIGELEELRDHLQGAVDTAQGISFPGMFG